MSNGIAALAKVEPQTMVTRDSRSAVAPRNMDDVFKMACAIAKSGLYGVKSEEEAMIRMATGMELGFSMMQSIRGVYVMAVGGKNVPGLYADMMVGACKAHPSVCQYFRLVESSATKATYATLRTGEPGEVTMTFTIEQAKQAGLTSKDTWKSYPDAMLRARASTALARAVYPDLLNGLYSVEELRDIPSATSVTADGEVIESASLDGQLQASVDAENLCAELEGDLKACETEEAIQGVAELIAAAHKGGRISEAHRKKLRVTFSSMSKKFKQAEAQQ